MKKILLQYFWIYLIGFVILTVFVLTLPKNKNRLDFIEEEIKKVQEKKKILTIKEKELEKLATDKEWDEVDKDTTK
jgi:hypothetical protein